MGYIGDKGRTRLDRDINGIIQMDEVVDTGMGVGIGIRFGMDKVFNLEAWTDSVTHNQHHCHRHHLVLEST
jgi:hypothetical protein